MDAYTSRSISIHSLRVEGDWKSAIMNLPIFISIHSLRVEGDHGTCERSHRHTISIHSLRVEGDSVMLL